MPETAKKPKRQHEEIDLSPQDWAEIDAVNERIHAEARAVKEAPDEEEEEPPAVTYSALRPGERYSSTWPGTGWAYTGQGKRGGKKWKKQRPKADGSSLAEHIAQWWNLHGEPGESDMDAAAAELDGTGWGVWRSPESGEWEALSMENADSLPDDAVVVYAAQRAPAGGVEIKGKHYKGGQWIPGAALAEASPDVKARITKAANVHKERVRSRMATREQVRAKTEKHKDRDLTARQKTQAKQMLAQLIEHHGEHVVSRLDEIAEQTQAMLDRITEDAPNDVMQEQLETRLAQLHLMTGLAEERGHGKEYEEEAKKHQEGKKPKEEDTVHKPEPAPEPPAEKLVKDLTTASEAATMPSDTETQSGGTKMSTAAEKQPWEMTRAEYDAEYDAAKTPEARKALESRGFVGGHKAQIMRALREGKAVPQEAIDGVADAVEYQEKERLKAEFGADYLDRISAAAKRVAPVHEIVRQNADGSTMVRSRQLKGGGFHEHAKGDIVAAAGEPKIVAKAKKGYKTRHDGDVTGYFQDIVLRDPKPVELAGARAAIAAKQAEEQLAHQAANRDYPALKKQQMAEHRALVAAALSAESA